MTQAALQHGDTVVATDLRPSALDALASQHGPDRLRVLPLDVTQEAAVARAFDAAKAAFGRVDVVFNNAGVALVGEIEGTPVDLARRVFDVNFWGAVHVSRAAVRFFREENPAGAGGRLITTSSAAGIRPVVGVPYYTASKFGEPSPSALSSLFIT